MRMLFLLLQSSFSCSLGVTTVALCTLTLLLLALHHHGSRGGPRGSPSSLRMGTPPPPSPPPPGPRPWPLVGNLFQLGDQIHLSLTSLRERYGDVYQLRMGSLRVVVLSGHSTLRQALVRQGEAFAGRPELFSFAAVAGGTSMTFSEKYGEAWTLHKRVCKNALRNFAQARPSSVSNTTQVISRDARDSHASCLLEERVRAEALGLVEALLHQQNQEERSREGKWFSSCQEMNEGSVGGVEARGCEGKVDQQQDQVRQEEGGIGGGGVSSGQDKTEEGRGEKAGGMGMSRAVDQKQQQRHESQDERRGEGGEVGTGQERSEGDRVGEVGGVGRLSERVDQQERRRGRGGEEVGSGQERSEQGGLCRGVDPAPCLVVSVANVACALCFGKRYDYDDEEFLALVRINKEVMRLFGAGNLADFFPVFRYLPSPSLKGMMQHIRRMNHFMENHIAEHIKTYDKSCIRDITDALIAFCEDRQDSREGQMLSNSQIVRTVIDIFGAGFDTIIAGLQWSLLYLVKFPDVQDRIFQEIDDQVGSDRLPSFEDKPKMSYTEAFIFEVLRHASYMPFTIPHCTTENVTLNGYFIPKDTCVFVNQYQVNHDREIWGDPDTFRPERFLSQNDNNNQLNKELTEKVTIFGMGKRRCLGDGFARLEMFVFLTTLLQRMRLEAAPGQTLDLTADFGLTMKPKPYRIRLSPRRYSGDT